jgi:subtilase family serine protease
MGTMRTLVVSSFFVLALFSLSANTSWAQEAPVRHSKGQVMAPKSSIERPGDIGVSAHTHLRMFVPQGTGGRFEGQAQLNAGLPPFLGLFFETPASIACVYHLVHNPKPGCNPDETTEPPSGGRRSIALIEAFDDPTAASDLQTFSRQFGLPAADLTVVFADGKRPKVDPSGGAELETSLDIEWAHAMAPKAKLFLVEAAALRFSDLFNAIIVGSNLVAANGGGEVSMSFGSSEFPQETQFDDIFTTPRVVYLASSGDSPGTQYPSSSPNVISAGGTTLSRDSMTGRFLLENTWQDSGGGPSLFEPRPSFQNVIAKIVGQSRGTPHFSFDANPNTGVWIFDSNPVFGTGWFVVGGTSVSAPSLAGIINLAGDFRASSQLENHEIYDQLRNERNIRDIEFGNCGLNIGDFAREGWDFCTGVGSNLGLQGK